MDPKKEFKIPTYAKWLLGIVLAVVVLGFTAVNGFAVVLVGILVGSILVAAWPFILVYFVVVGLIGALVSQKRSGVSGPGVAAGLLYGSLGLLVFLVIAAIHAISTGFH